MDRAVARLFAARARQEAVGRNRIHDYEGARAILVGTARRIRSYSGQDPELSAIAGLLEREEAVYAAPMPEDARKQAHFASANLMRSRDAVGRSVKRG